MTVRVEVAVLPAVSVAT
jgi:hypothetical protein